jgi:hypothetical protein
MQPAATAIRPIAANADPRRAASLLLT